MKDIKVLGPGCPKCRELYKQTELAIKEIGLDASLVKVTDIQEITGYGVMMTPALVVNGQVKICGKVPSLDQLKEMINSDN
ncbi:MAG: thioredoxin family protein [candidate division Zixibacteria bacterium]